MSSSIIVIPARYGSTRFPGKPLALIAGKSMLSRVYDVARAAAGDNTLIVVATDDKRIADHCDEIGAKHVMTPSDCRTGTDRALAAVEALGVTPDNILNLQGDAPLTPPSFVKAMLSAFEDESVDIVTPVTQLSWERLDRLRASKIETPFSGTTAILNSDSNAVWFSKNIIPAIRNEEKLRSESALSPVFGHIGLYGYRRAVLKEFVSFPESTYEKLEGLEQLRALENGLTIRCVQVDYENRPSMSGVDSPEDVARVEALLTQHQLD